MKSTIFDNKNLSPRQKEIAALVGEGIPNKEIARRLSISESAVKWHLTNVYRICGWKKRTDLILWVSKINFERGIVPPPVLVLPKAEPVVELPRQEKK